MVRIIAVLLLVIPGIISAYGIKLMRDSLFEELYPLLLNLGIQFFTGFILFLSGIAFIGGFIVYRDRKRQFNAKNNRIENQE